MAWFRSLLSRTFNQTTFHVFEEVVDFDEAARICSEFNDQTTLVRISSAAEFLFVEAMITEVLDNDLIADPIENGALDIPLWISKISVSLL